MIGDLIEKSMDILYMFIRVKLIVKHLNSNCKNN